jgi:hypothetical protein
MHEFLQTLLGAGESFADSCLGLAHDLSDLRHRQLFPVPQGQQDAVLAGAGVILGGLIDYGTGAVYSLQPNPVVAMLKCRGYVQARAVTPGMIPTAALSR